MAATSYITFSGVAFRYPDPALVTRLERFGFPRDMLPERITPGPALQRIGFPDGLPYPSPKINQWFYPVGASRCGVFRGIMTSGDLDAVKEVVWPSSSSTPTAGTFSIRNDVTESEGAVETSMYLLSAFPVAVDADGVGTLFLVTLVDERYYWHQCESAGVITCTGSTSDWSEIIDQIATRLGITLTYSAISSDYGYPEPDSPIYSNYESAAVLLDMAAANVGCAVVRAMDGTYSLQRWSDAVAAVSADRPDTTYFGGEFVSATTQLEYRSVMPASVLVVFPKWVDGSGYYEPESYRQMVKDSYGASWTYSATLAALGSPYSSYPNNGTVKVIHTTAKARFTLAGDVSPNNETALTTLAKKIAKDYYDARTAWVDECYRGVRGLTPNGLSDFLYCVDGGGVWTRAIPPPLNAGMHNFQHSTGAVAIPSATLFTVVGRTGSQTISSGDTLTLANGVVSATDTWTPDTASASLAGIVSTTAQTFAGDKTFDDDVIVGDSLHVNRDQTMTGAALRVSETGSMASSLFGGGIRLQEEAAVVGAEEFDIWLETSFIGVPSARILYSNAAGSESTELRFVANAGTGGYNAVMFLDDIIVLDAFSAEHLGLTGTGGGGDTFVKGVLTALGTGPTVIDGGTF